MRGIITMTKHRYLLAMLSVMLLGAFELTAQVTVTGTVVGAEQDPLPGVNVVVKGTTNGTITDIDGQYTIEVPSEDDVLVFSMIGMLKEEIPVGNQNEINVTLVEDLVGLDEVVVVGYGTMKKSDVTGAIISLKDEDLNQVKSTNVIENLQGKAAGVDITRTSGEAGSGFDIKIRGERSLSGNNDPLYIVDGIQYGSGININPSDIESIEILKDVSSTAIYGSKGANGVVIITTKKGKAGKPKVTFSTYTSWNEPLGSLPYMDREAYMTYKQDLANFNEYYTTGSWPDQDAEVFYEPFEQDGIDNGTDTRWIDLITRTGRLNNYFLSVVGGKESFTYNLSLDHTKEKGMLDQDTYKRYVLRGGMNVEVTDFLSVGTNNILSFIDRNRMAFPERRVRLQNPLAEPYDSTGALITNPTVSSTELTPLWYFQDDYYVEEELTTRIFSSVYADVKIMEGLNFRTTFNADITTERNGLYEQAGVEDVNVEMFIKPQKDMTWSNVLTFNKTFGIHHLQVTGVHELLKGNAERYRIAGIDPAVPNSRWYALDGMDEITVTLDPDDDERDTEEAFYYSEDALLSFLGRINYSLLGKYVFSASLRYDGSSILAEGNQWDYFPAASVAWNAYEEGFIKSIDVISLLKIRAGYGVSGNFSVPPYSSIDRTNTSPLYYEYGDPENVTYGYRPVFAGNPSLGWEKTASYNIGIDFGFFDNRISGNIDFYKANTTDLLQKRALPAHAAIPFIYDNVGETETSGIELMLRTVNVSSSSGFSWTTDITFTKNNEKIVELASGVEKDELNGWFQGEPIEVYYDYEKTGIWQFEDSVEMASFTENEFTFGDIKIKDQNGDGIINEADRKVIGTPRPDWYGSFTNRFEYKGFDLNIMIMARMGQTIQDRVMTQMQVRDDYAENGMEVDYWTPVNPTDEAPRLDPSISQINYYPYASTLEYTDGSWVKVRDITLGYSLPSEMLERLKISRVRIYGSLKNYFVLYSPFYDKGRYDPEKNGSTNWPIPKSAFLGISLEF